VRLGGASRAQLEAVHAHENERLAGLGSSLSIADVLRAIIEQAAIQRGLAASETERSHESRPGLRIELQRRRSNSPKAKKTR
jgi:hypothetical protein